MLLPAQHAIDSYKGDHRRQYPAGTELVFSNWTGRTSRIPGVEATIHFGLAYYLQEFLRDRWNLTFFSQPKEKVIKAYIRRMAAFGVTAHPDHMEALHDLGYLPIEIWSLPEGTRVPIGVPSFVIWNTIPEFFWLPNYLETSLSHMVWGPTTTATTADLYMRMLAPVIEATGGAPEFVNWQGHDFSSRGMFGEEAAALSGAGHLTSFTGSDTVHAPDFLEMYYGADVDKELVCGSVPATEHSVMCAGSKEGELETYRRLLTEVYPTGIASIVSDTWDYWAVWTDILPQLRDVIMQRDGKLVIRPDSGDPVKIICGDLDAPAGSPAFKGSFELAWELFGGTVNDKGYKVLDPHIGLIYGDSITPDRARRICDGLRAKRFVPTMVLGVGSFCVAPETPILCSDMVWRPAGEIKEGQEIIAFDEDPTFKDGRKAARRYKKAHIVWNKPATKPCRRVTTDIGPAVTASDDHPWLVWADTRTPATIFAAGHAPDGGDKRKLPRGPGLAWKTTAELRPGDKLAFFSHPWAKEDTHAAGWLEGMFDGEGSLSRSTGNDRIPAWKINISQNEGPILRRLRKELADRDFSFYENTRDCPQLVLTGGWTEVLRFLGTIGSERLKQKLPEVIADMPALKQDYTFRLATVQNIEAYGDSAVASIRTSSGTFITGGYLTHNTYQFVTRDTYGFAMKATACSVNGELREIFKDPKTDNGTKKSARGLLAVFRDAFGKLCLKQQATWDEVRHCEFQQVFCNGNVLNLPTLAEIRARVAESR